MKSKKTNFTYIVAGMGRSGTSFLAQCLKNNGVDIGEKFYMGENPRHGYENQEFVDLNKKVFTEAGMGWGIGSLPADTAKLKEAFENNKQAYRDLIKKYKGNVWGVKEPRLSLLLEWFMELILEEDDDPFIYVAFRRPRKVGESLKNLNNTISVEKGEETARKYNERLIRFLIKHYA